MKESPSVFTIIGISADKKVRVTGTAFFINAEGCFITAAHTFRSSTQGFIFYAMVNRKRYGMIPILHEYAKMDRQMAPDHLDLFIGQLLLDHKNEHLEFCNSSAITAGSDLRFSGFRQISSKGLKSEMIQPMVADPNIETMDDVWDRYENGHNEQTLPEDNENNRFVDEDGFLNLNAFDLNAEPGTELPPVESGSDNEPSVDSEVVWLDELDNTMDFQITGHYVRETMENIFPLEHVAGTFTNVFEFQLDDADLKPSGFSGGPVLYQGRVAGMLISKNAAITSEYLMKCLGQRQTLFKLTPIN